MFESYFFDKHALTDYQVFRLLKAQRPDGFTINRLSLQSGLSYSQTYNAFHDIMETLQAMKHNAGQVLDEAAFGPLAADLTVDDYRFYLLQQSIAFQFFDYLFQEPAPNVHDFCEAHNISLSTLRRRLAAFKGYLASKRLHLNARTWALEGDELQIRIVILTFYKMAFRGAGWPFTEQRFQEARRRYNLLTHSDTQIFGLPKLPDKTDLMTLAVQAMRIDFGHGMTNPERLPDPFAAMRPAGESAVYNQATFPSLSSDQRVSERNFYDFCRRHYISLSETVTPQDEIIMQALAKPGTRTHAFADGLLTFLIAHCDPASAEADPNRHAVLRVNLHRIADAYLTFRGSFAQRLDFMNPTAPLARHGRLPQLIARYFDEVDPQAVGPLATYYEEMYQTLYIVIAPDFPSLNADHKLKVAAIVDTGTFMSRDLMAFLRGIDFIEVVTPSRDVLPDVIVTTLNSDNVLSRYYTPERLAKVRVVNWQAAIADEDFFNLLSILQDTQPRAVIEKAGK